MEIKDSIVVMLTDEGYAVKRVGAVELYIIPTLSKALKFAGRMIKEGPKGVVTTPGCSPGETE